MKKIIGFILAVILMISCFSVVASADVGDYYFDEVEPNSTTSYADRIYNDYTVVGSISSDLDIDHFKFVLYSPAYVTIIGAADYSTMAVLLMDSESEGIAAGIESWGGNGTPLDTIANEYLSAGTYYIALFNQDNYYSGNDYLLYFSYTTVTDDSNDWNDNYYDDNTNTDEITYTWQNFGGVWYCVKPDGTYVKNHWVQDSAGWCYLGGDGRILYNQWIFDGIGWAFVGTDGYMLSNQWINDAQGWCYLGGNGYCITNGWVEDSRGWCFMGSDSRMVYNQWVYDGIGWAFVDANGYMLTNQWISDAQGWCYVGGNGYLLTNYWIQDSQGWCYLGDNGYMVTNGWASDNNGWCYMNSNGRMVYSTWVYNDGWYYINDSGYMISNQWMLDSKGWCYLGENGRMITNDWVKDTYGWCYLNSNGYIVKNDWINIDGDWYYVNFNGNAVTGWQTIGGKEYYFYNSCVMAKNTLIDGYWVGTDGAYVPNYNRYDYPFTFGETFILDAFAGGKFEITVGTNYSFDVIDNRYSDYHLDKVIRVPMTIKNIGSSTDSINMFAVNYFNSTGQEIPVSIKSYFDDGNYAFNDIRSGGTTTGYFYLLYSSDGIYSIEFEGKEVNVEVQLNIK